MNYLRKAFSLVIALLGLNFVILVHEFGHFSFAKFFGVRAPVFSVGFDPAITSIKVGATKFQLGTIPLGGYVSINNYDLDRKPYLQKMAIILAGILFNFIFAFLILYYLYSKKIRREYEELDLEHNETIGLRSLISKATPEKAKILLMQLSKRGLVGPIGILSIISQSISLGLDVYLYFLAIISLNIGFFNLFPLSFLDGGQAAYFTLQALFGHGTVNNSFFNILYYLTIALALIFTLLISLRDVLRLRRPK